MRDILLHAHIFKNAGTSFDWSLARCFGEGFVDHREDRAMIQGGASYLAGYIQENPGVSALSSHHLCYPLPELDEVRLHQCLLIRHPLDRITSVYNFERRQEAETRGAVAAKQMDFKAYVEWRMRDDVPRTIRDYQTLNVAGDHAHMPGSRVPYQRLWGAVSRIMNLQCVGVVDRYDESMVVFEHALAKFLPDLDLSYVPQNVSVPEAMTDPLDSRVSDVLEQLGGLAPEVLRKNSCDIVLYNVANQRLDETIRAVPDFAERLAVFRQRCTGHL